MDVICSVCGKEFFPAPYHSYKDKRPNSGGKLVCSWHCVCQSERLAKEEKAKKQKVIQMFDTDGKLLHEFCNAKDACIRLSEMGIESHPRAIQEACRGLTKTSFGFVWKYQFNESK